MEMENGLTQRTFSMAFGCWMAAQSAVIPPSLQPNIENLLSQNIRNKYVWGRLYTCHMMIVSAQHWKHFVSKSSNKDIWGRRYTLSYDDCSVRCFQLHCHCSSVTVVTLWHGLSEKAKSWCCFCRHIAVHDYVKSFWRSLQFFFISLWKTQPLHGCNSHLSISPGEEEHHICD